MQIDSKLCRMSIVPDKNDNITYVASVDEYVASGCGASLVRHVFR